MRTSATSFIASAAAACALVVAGCAVKPEPLKSEDVRKRYAADQYLLYAEQEPITAAIDLNTAIARALKYNLDYRLKLMERALATGLWDVSRYDMLPKVVASAGYATRNNDSGGTSVSIFDGRETLSPSTSQERNRWLANAEFSWNLLDFGLSYYRAKQLADETLISEERRRRVIQNIVQDTRSAYWRAVGAQRLAKKADDLLARVKWALERSRRAEAEGLLPPVKALAYQRDLLDATTLLNIRRQELEFSKRELAALMNVTPGTNFTLADEKEPQLPPPPRNIGELEEVALEHRPELREEDYRKRISVAETRKALLSLLPGISIDFAGRYDSNRYLYNQSWIDGGIQIFSNLMRLLAYPSVEKANELRLKADDARRVALSMAILTQVRVSVQRYELSLVDLDLAEQSTQVDSRLAQYARVALSMRVDSELELVRTEARALIAEFQRYASYANAQAAYGRILNSLGVDVLPDEVQSAQVDALAQAVASEIKKAARETFPVALAPVKRQAPTIQVQIENIKGQALKVAAEEAAIRVLRTAGYRINGRDPRALRLRMRLDVTRVSAGVDRGAWDIRLERADGTLVGHSEYSSPLAAQFRPSTMDAFTDAATVSQLSALSSWIDKEKSRSGSSFVQADAAQQSEAQPAPVAPQPLTQDEEAIRAPLAAWTQAWAAQDVERYLGSYAPGFKPGDGQSRRAWERERRARVSEPERIQVSISGMRVLQRNEGRAVVMFRQDYRSDRYRDSVQKRLELVRNGERWLIAEERVVTTLSDTDTLTAEATATAWRNEEKLSSGSALAQADAAAQGEVQLAPAKAAINVGAAPREASESLSQESKQEAFGSSFAQSDAARHTESRPAAESASLDTVALSVEMSSTDWSGEGNRRTGVSSAQQGEAKPAPIASQPVAQIEEGVLAPVVAWAEAWASQDVERYLGSYAPGFEPADGSSRKAWEGQRRELISKPGSIRVAVSEMQVLQRINGRAEVTFRQDYRSDSYQDSVRKRLELVRHGERWLIAGEHIVATLAGPGTEPASGVATAWLNEKKSGNRDSVVATETPQIASRQVQPTPATEAPQVATRQVQQSPATEAPQVATREVQQSPTTEAPQVSTRGVQPTPATEAPQTVMAEVQTSGRSGAQQKQAKAETVEASTRPVAVAHKEIVAEESASAPTAARHTASPNRSEPADKQAGLHVALSCKRGGIEFPQFKGRCLY